MLSTKIPQSTPDKDHDFTPPQEDEAYTSIASITRINDTTSKAYYNFIEKLFIISYAGIQYIFVAYHYNAKAILEFCIKNRIDAEFSRVLTVFCACFKKDGISPNLHILNNEASANIRHIIVKNNAIFQLVEPYNKRVNTTEFVTQTFKNHLIAGLCTKDKLSILQLWDRLIEQAKETHNMLRTARVKS